jgi:hypothetical protein
MKTRIIDDTEELPEGANELGMLEIAIEGKYLTATFIMEGEKFPIGTMHMAVISGDPALETRFKEVCRDAVGMLVRNIFAELGVMDGETMIQRKLST